MGQYNEALFDRKGPNFSSWTNETMGRIYTGSSDDTDEVVVNHYVDVQGSGDDAHSKIARKVAAEGTVLLKNDGLLPLLHNAWMDGDKTINRVGIFGEDAGEGKGPNFCKDRGCNQGTLGSGWGSGAVEFPYLISPIAALKEAFNPETIHVTEFLTNEPPFKTSPEILKEQDICIVFANSDSGEGFLSAGGIAGDRNDLYLQKSGDELIAEVAEGCGDGKGKTIVVIHSVGPVILENWIDLPGVKAVVWANLPGQESGNALVDILFGDVNPSGKLPYTIGKSMDDYGEGAKVLYRPNGVIPQQNYSEGLYIDYRYFDKAGIEPRYEFGYGLSYTIFDYANLVASPVKNKTPLPSPRPVPESWPPKYSEEIPDPQTVLFPPGFRRLNKFIYPYLDSPNIKKGSFNYPDGYDGVQLPSEAGGDEGGNPSLYDVHVNISVDITNSGHVAGAEVVQLYLSYPQSPSSAAQVEPWKFDTNMTDFPVKVLRGFEKVFLEKGETKRVYFTLTRRDLSFWDVVQQNWVMPTGGAFRIAVGSSSRDLRLKTDY
jgi:beta-glucosidase